MERARKHGLAIEIVDHQKYVKREEYDRILIDILKERGVDLVILAGGKGTRIKKLTSYNSKVSCHYFIKRNGEILWPDQLLIIFAKISKNGSFLSTI